MGGVGAALPQVPPSSFRLQETKVYFGQILRHRREAPATLKESRLSDTSKTPLLSPLPLSLRQFTYTSFENST